MKNGSQLLGMRIDHFRYRQVIDFTCNSSACSGFVFWGGGIDMRSIRCGLLSSLYVCLSVCHESELC